MAINILFALNLIFLALNSALLANGVWWAVLPSVIGAMAVLDMLQ